MIQALATGKLGVAAVRVSVGVAVGLALRLRKKDALAGEWHVPER